ncbi:MAG: NAD-dependent protein deacylase [Chloroflexi bacterium]|nr:NAD-dependent protein deacylase [Chloroflexota bacterium]
MDSRLTQQIEEAARVLSDARYAIALAGAGISVESGIRPFRGKGGLWTEKGEPPMDGYLRFMRDPASGWREMLARRAAPGGDEFSKSLAAAEPNAAHRAMERLEELGVLRHVISQNIDDLHFRAGSVSVTEIHGNRTKVRCVECGARWVWDEFLALAAAQESHSTDRDPTNIAEMGGVMVRVPPECPQCAGIVKSDVVMFGEPIPQEFLESCQREAELADCCLIVGTSATVYPAAAFPEMVLRAGGTIVDVNTDENPFTPYASAVLRGPAGELLPPVVKAIERLRS